MISRAANIFAARLALHQPAACEFSRGGRFDVWPCILVIHTISFDKKFQIISLCLNVCILQFPKNRKTNFAFGEF